MKLYATTTSERASKGQGGNEYIIVNIKDDNKETIGEVWLQISQDSLGDIIFYRTWFHERLYPWNENRQDSKKMINLSDEANKIKG